jgi:hypothetical protein
VDHPYAVERAARLSGYAADGILRRLEVDHAPWIATVCNDPEMSRYTGGSAQKHYAHRPTLHASNDRDHQLTVPLWLPRQLQAGGRQWRRTG